MKDGLIPAPIARRPLHEELAEHLRQLIIECALEPGSKISEKDLCTQFAVSRTPLREALKLLATEGLVQLTPHRGASVTELTTEELEHIFPVMGALEALAGELACLHVTDAEIERAKKLQAELEAQHKSGDLKGYFRTNEEVPSTDLRRGTEPDTHSDVAQHLWPGSARALHGEPFADTLGSRRQGTSRYSDDIEQT